MKRISIGEAIRAELDRQERSVVWFARHLSCDRTNVYKIFAKDSIDTELLMRISITLNHNFFEDLSRDFERGMMQK
ncbi:MAG: XRE family transcriptional regulator [Alistipes sp.]|nr:XRE family transcriptional regulator [Alistipes sp.]